MDANRRESSERDSACVNSCEFVDRSARRTNNKLRVTWRRGLAAAAAFILLVGCVDVVLGYYVEASAGEVSEGGGGAVLGRSMVRERVALQAPLTVPSWARARQQ